ncbi:MAG: fructosamine kinase family protein [bacterium]|nr:fructosamine kinase family protein [bacterium]
MFDSRLQQFLESIIFQTFGKNPSITEIQYVGGGCINNTLKVSFDKEQYFVKWNEDEENDMFQKEELGLSKLREVNSLNIPKTYQFGRIEGRNYLIMEFIEREATKDDFWEILGQNLAALHQNTQDTFGLDHNNYIGRLPQKNDKKSNWIDFLIDNRFEVQLGLAIYNGLINSDFAKKFRNLYPQLPGLLVQEPSSLLHGDLWSGNFMVGRKGLPFLIDPAIYYGNREVEIAFTQLFGGFDRKFYNAYNEVLPLESDFQTRAEIYNLYPLLVHVNLFGTSYLSGIQRVLNKYC